MIEQEQRGINPETSRIVIIRFTWNRAAPFIQLLGYRLPKHFVSLANVVVIRTGADINVEICSPHSNW